MAHARAGQGVEEGCTYGHETRGLLWKLVTVLTTLILAAISIACFAHGSAGAAKDEVSALRTGQAVLDDRWKALDPRLSRIEQKIDELLKKP